MSSAHRTAGGGLPEVDLFAGFFRGSQRNVQVRVEEGAEEGQNFDKVDEVRISPQVRIQLCPCVSIYI
jgi:hypothetical protein